MSLLSEIKTIADSLEVPVETGKFSKTAPETYLVLIPLYDTYHLYADNKPSVDVEEVRISIFTKKNYLRLKKTIETNLLNAEITITDRHYVGHEDDTGYHHYVIDVEKEYLI